MNKQHEMPIHEIPDKVFSIPWYQRGYRWTADNIEALLNDLLAFSKTDDSLYCLQPLVLQQKDDGLWVVDGQQRLTTLAIILRTLGLGNEWNIKYMAEGGQLLSELLNKPGTSINDVFRKEAKEKITEWLGKENNLNREEALRAVLTGKNGKGVVFLRYDIGPGEDGDEVFKRLNAGKTPLTSSELIRALFMEAGNGLDHGEKADIAKEWDLIESSMVDESFWAIWPTERFQDVPTRIDFLFSVVADVSGEAARQDPLAVYRAVEKRAKEEGLGKVWEQMLRCWWWMQSCHADDEAHHLLGWLALFSNGETRVLYRKQWLEAAGRRMEAFKWSLQRMVAGGIGDGGFESFRYDTCDSWMLKKVFVLLNMLEAQKQGIRFRFDLFRKDLFRKRAWEVEHIASQTDNPLTGKEEREEWLRLARSEMSDAEWEIVKNLDSFEAKRAKIDAQFSGGDAVADKHGMGNLALLDAETNHSYKNAIFPAKRRLVLLEAGEKRVYVPPCTAAAFAKTYSPGAAQMRYWSEADARAYHGAMRLLFEGFMAQAKEESK